MTVQKHLHSEQHRGLVPDDQLSSDTPSDGQVLTWHTGPTRTWDTPSGGGGGGGGTVMSARAYGTSADSISSGSEEKVTISDNPDWDDWSGMLSGDDFVVPTGQAGKYNVFGGSEIVPRSGGNAPTSGYVEVSIRDTTGATYFDKTNATYHALVDSGGEFPKVAAVLDLADGDSVSLWVANGTNKTVDLNNGGPPFSSWLAIEKLS